MGRLEPGAPMLARLVFSLSETNEGLHLVSGAAHRLHPISRLGDLTIRQNGHQVRLILQAP
ncbi:hypothetical protein D3C73_668360 [compost metagenome]